MKKFTETQKIIEKLKGEYPDKPALTYNTTYQLLVAVILSAQCTDERVNMVTKELFKEYGTPDKMVLLTNEELTSLDGVGRKTANVVLSVGFNKPAIAVDTHVFRVSRRIGFSNGNTPDKVEEDLKKSIKKEDWSKSHHFLIYHGRRVCHARKPNCSNCVIKEFCDYGR